MCDGVVCDWFEIGLYYYVVVFKCIIKLKDDSGLFGESWIVDVSDDESLCDWYLNV